MRGKLFLHADRIPLDEVNLDGDPNQLTMFMGECDGLCGV